MLLRSLLAGLLAFSVCSTRLVGQSDATSVQGLVRDPSGAVIVRALVIVENEATGAERRAATNEAGRYVVLNLPPGTYTIQVEASGFRTTKLSHHKLDPSVAATIDVAMQVGSATESIQVVASAAHVQTETSVVSKLVTGEQITSLQLNGRNPIFLAQLMPGVRRNTSISSFSFGLSTGPFAINGSRNDDNLITIDGAPSVRTRAAGSSIGVADVDATQEVQILTAGYSAEFGRSSGGQIRIVTKSGSKDFHGAFYEYLRNSAMDANSWARNASGDRALAGSPAPIRFNQFGYSLSGPVAFPGTSFNKNRNKLFWLFDQEYVRYRQYTTIMQRVPSAAMRTGDFSELLSATNIFYGRAVPLRDPSTGAAIPNNVIPAGLLSSNGLGLLRAFPLPTPGFNQGGNNWVATGGAPQNQRKDTISIDFHPIEQHSIRARFQNYAFNSVGPFGLGNMSFDRAPMISDRPNKIGSLNYVWTVGPAIVNEFLVTVSVDRVRIVVDTSKGLHDRQLYGISYPLIYPDGKEIPSRIPTVQIANFNTLEGGPYPGGSSGPIYTFSDNVSVVRSRHTLKFGIRFERTGENDNDQGPRNIVNQNGRFTFTDGRGGAPSSGAAVANAALGLFDVYGEYGQKAYTPFRSNMFEYFAQDSWRVTNNLVLEYGLRHSLMQPYYSLWRNTSVFAPQFYDPAKAAVLDSRTGLVRSGDRYNGLVIPGASFPDSAKGRFPDPGNSFFRGLDKSYSQFHKKDFQPRFGLAYTFSSKSVLRAGGGRFFSRPVASDSIYIGSNAPFQPTATVTAGSVNNPAGATGGFAPFSLTTLDPILPNPNAWTWHATVERELSGSTIVSIGYVGRRALNLARERNINQLQPGTIQANPGMNADYLRQYKGFSEIRLGNTEATSLYSGLQISLTRRYSKGLLYGLAYTLSKSTDSGSAYTDVIPNAFDATKFRGSSDFDTRHMLVVNFIYDVPVFRNIQSWTGKLLGGWQITGVTQAQTGSPFTVRSGDDIAGVGPGSGQQIWNISGEPVLPRGDRQFASSVADAKYWFNIRNADNSLIFARPSAGTFTTQQNRNLLYGPGFQNWNLGLTKRFAITEKQRLQFRFEAFNWLNHPNWNTPNIAPANLATLGKVTAKSSERNLQVSLRYSF